MSLLVCSLCQTGEGSIRVYGDMYRVSLIEEFFVDAISPPEETSPELILSHTDHESAYDECMESSVEYDDVSSLHRWDDLSLDTIEEIS